MYVFGSPRVSRDLPIRSIEIGKHGSRVDHAGTRATFTVRGCLDEYGDIVGRSRSLEIGLSDIARSRHGPMLIYGARVV